MVQVTDTAWIWGCCGCGVGQQLTVPIQPLAWELLYAVGVALKKKKKKERKKETANEAQKSVL